MTPSGLTVHLCKFSLESLVSRSHDGGAIAKRASVCKSVSAEGLVYNGGRSRTDEFVSGRSEKLN